MLAVTDVDAAIAFYRDVLGFRCLNATDGWACLAHGDTEVMLALPNTHLPFEKPLLTGSLYFRTDDVGAWWARLKDRCPVEYPLENFEYGMREFAIRDNSGYLLQFGKPVA